MLSRTNTTKSVSSINNSEWSENLEDIVKSWALKAVMQREMHTKSAKYYNRMSTHLTLPLIMLTTLTSVGSFGAVDSAQYKIWMYTTGALNLISAFLASMVKYWKPDEKCSMHTRMSKLFDIYHRDLTIQLGLSSDEREKPDELIERAKKNMEELINESPMVSDKITNRVIMKHNIEVPNDFDIVIYGRNEIQPQSPILSLKNKNEQVYTETVGKLKKNGL